MGTSSLRLEVLKLLLGDFRPVKVRLTEEGAKYISGIFNEQYGEGDVVTLPLWLAFKLVEDGKAVYDYNLTEAELKMLGSYVDGERYSGRMKLNPLSKNFYLEVKLLSKNLTDEERKKVRKDLEDLVMLRLQKIVRLAMIPGDVNIESLNVTDEEAVLLYKLKDLISAWVQGILRETIGERA